MRLNKHILILRACIRQKLQAHFNKMEKVKRFFVRLEKIGKSDIININKGSESE